MLSLRNWRRIYAFLLLSLLYVYEAEAATCPTFSGKLQGQEHNVAGSFSVAEDCTLKATQFSYDGGAPAVYWWSAPDCNAATIKKQGKRISDDRLAKAYNNGELSVSLFTNVEWSKVGCVLLYCEEFYADLGHAAITERLNVPSSAISAPSPSPSASSASASPPMETVSSLPNCMELISGYFNLHWALNNDSTVTLGLEGRPGNGNFWLGFGFSGPQAIAPVMVGSNVVIGGFINGQCFAYNYELSAKSQCDFSTGEGVCPDFAGKQPLVPSTSAKLISCEQTGDKINFVINRPLATSDGLQNAWPSDGSQYSIFAMGPVSEGSNATVPVVLYHNLQLPGTTAPTSVTSLMRDPIKLNFAKSQQNCRDIVPLLNTGGPSAAPAPARLPVATIDGPTTFAVTIGSNKNYPNPPAWGYSLWVNGQESPVLVVKRGTKYTIMAEAGKTHPVYITTSIIGGGYLVNFQDETIFAGNATTFGTPTKPKTYTWTPDKQTPNIVYYQCAIHQKLGWQIKVIDPGTPSMAISPAPQPMAPSADTVPSSTSTGCTMTIYGKTLSYEACFPVNNIGSKYHLAWNLKPLPSNAEEAYELDMAMNSTTDGYVAVGFPSTPGQMVGSIAMVLSSCPSCPTGANVTQYSLKAQSQSGVVPGSELNAMELAASAADGVVAGRFKVVLPKTSGRRRRALLLSNGAAPQLAYPPSSFPLIFSAGSISSTGQLQQHSTRGSGTINLMAATKDAGNTAESIVGGATNTSARLAHMWLMAISFGVLMPIAILIAYVFPPPQHPWSFQLHRALQTLSFAMACGGITAAFVGVGGWNAVPAYSVHRDIGITVMVLAFVMTLSLVWRPSLGSKIRKSWAMVHRWLGRCTAVLAIANIYYGIIHIGQLGAWAWATYTAILCVILVVAFGKSYIVERVNGGATGEEKKGQSVATVAASTA